jgi:hypothetical protein
MKASIEHDPEKWTPVFPRDKRGTRLRGDHAQTKRPSLAGSSAPLPKFVMPWGASDTNFGSKGALLIHDFQCRSRFEVPVANLRHPVQELQIGGTRLIVIGRRTPTKPTWTGFSAQSQLPQQD